MSYFMIHCNEDGEISVFEFKTKGDFLRDMENEYFGQVNEMVFSTELPKNYYYTSEYTIIKGEIVTPTPKRVVTKFELE